jgi:hypothetical protein
MGVFSQASALHWSWQRNVSEALPQGFVLGTVPLHIFINYLVEEG